MTLTTSHTYCIIHMLSLSTLILTLHTSRPAGKLIASLTVVEIRVRNWLAVFPENQTFCRLLIAVPLKMYSRPTKMDFGWPNAEIGQKMPMASCSKGLNIIQHIQLVML